MEAILVWLTLIVVGAVVVVLALYLSLIAVSLSRANRNLAQLVGGLTAIRDNTAPLTADLSSINSAAVALRDRLLSADGHLRAILQLARR